MPVLLELYEFWTVEMSDRRCSGVLCPVCGRPLEPGQEAASFIDRWTRAYYVVHEECEVPLHELLTKEEADERDLQPTR